MLIAIYLASFFASVLSLSVTDNGPLNYNQKLEKEFCLQGFENFCHLGLFHSEIFKYIDQEPLFDSFGRQNVDLIELRYKESYSAPLGPIISKIEKRQFIFIVKRKIPDSNGHFLMGALRGLSSSAVWNAQERDYFETEHLGQYWPLFEEKFAMLLNDNEILLISSLFSRPNMENLKTKSGPLLGIGSLLLSVVERKNPGKILYLESKIESVPFYYKKGFQLLIPEMKVPRYLDSVKYWLQRNRDGSIEEISIQDFVHEHLKRGRQKVHMTRLYVPMFKFLNKCKL